MINLKMRKIYTKRDQNTRKWNLIKELKYNEI